MKNYTYPPEVHIGGYVFKIALMDSYATNLFSPLLIGDTSQEEENINIALRTANGGYKSLNEVNQTMYHEITHQVNNIWGIGLDEKQVDQVAQGLMQALNSCGIQLILEVPNKLSTSAI